MTRDEAIAKYKVAVHAPGGVVWCANQQEMRDAMAKMEREAAAFVDAGAAFGVLKLDESEIVYSGPALAAIDAVIGNKFTSAIHVMRALDAAGYKIERK